MHLTDGPVLHKGNKKRKMGHARWQGAPGSPAEPPPNKKRKQNAPAASQKAPPLPPISAKKRKVAESSGLQSAWDLHPYNPTLHKSTEPQAKRSTVDRAVDNLLKPVRGAGTLDTWLSGGRAESSPGIGVLRDGIGGGTAVRVTPRQEERVSGPGGSGVNGHQTPSSGFANAGGGGFWAGLEGGAGVSVNGVNKPGSASQQGNNSLRLAGTVWRPCEGSFAEEPGLRAPLNGPAAPAEILTRGMVKDGGSPNPGPRLNGFRREYGAGNAEGGLKKLDEEGEGFVTRPLDGAGEGWVDGLPRDSRLSDEQRRLYGQPKTDIEVTGFEAAAVGTDGEGFPARNQSRETGHESATARTQTGGGEPWPGATVGPPAAEGKLRLPLRSDVMPASENRIMDEAVWERVVNGYGKRERVRVRKAEAFAALRAQRKQFLQRDATAQTLAELKLDPYAPRVREGFCQLARIMIRGGNEIGEVPAKAINAVRVWKDLSEKLFEGRTPVGGSPVTWLPKPIDELDETETKVLRKAVIKLAGGDGQDDAKAGHVAAGAGPQGGADVTREAGSGRKAKKKRKLELRKLEESGGVNGDARGAGGQSAGVTGPLLPTWQSQAFPSLGTEGPTVSGAEMGAHGQGGNGIGVDGHGLRAGRPDESLQRQHLLNGGGYASGVNGSGWGASEGGVNGRGAVEGSVNGAGLTGRNAYWGDGHQGSAGGTAANGGSQHWGPVTGAGANGNGVNGGVEHRVRLNGDSVHAGRFGDRDQKPKHEREPLQGGESAPNGHSHNSWGDSFGWQAPGSFPPGFGDRSAGPDARYKHPENHSRSGRPESPFVFSTTATSDADVAGGIWVNRSRLNGGLPAGFGQALGFDNAVRNHADGFGGRAGTGANGASPRRAGHDRGNSRRGNASQVPAFRGRSVVNVGQHVVGDALRY